MSSPANLKEIISHTVELLGYEFIAYELIPQGNRTMLRIYIDSPEGIKMSDCEMVSRQISIVLDVEDFRQGKYNLEVSSPGVDRLLVTQEHFQRFVGRRIKVKMRDSDNGRRNYSGLLQSVTEGNITIVVDGEPYDLLISGIEKANLVPEN